LANKTALFGGTFDPPHLGHLVLAQSLADAVGLDRVMFIPSGRPPHKPTRQITAAEHRCKMLSLAIDDNPRFQLSDWELNQPPPNYTINTVRHFLRDLPGEKLYWLIGSDSLGELHTWFRFEELARMIDILTAWRGGFELAQILGELAGRVSPSAFQKLKKNIIRTPMIELSSSQIREMVSQGREIRYLVADPVRDYIAEQGLYR